MHVSMPIKRVPAEIVFKAKDFDTVKSFYKAVLSLRVVDDEPESYVKFELGSLILRLEKTDFSDLPDNFGRTTQLYFKVYSIRELVETLNKLNVDYSIERETDGMRLDIEDPEGRMITFLSKY